MLDLAFVKLIHQVCSIAAVATPSEFSRCSPVIFDEILLFLCFTFDHNFSQMHVCTINERTDVIAMKWTKGLGYAVITPKQKG